jgi:hypothetical protein
VVCWACARTSPPCTGLSYTLLRSNAYLQNLLALAPMVQQTQGFTM